MKVNNILLAVIFSILLFFVFSVAYADDAPAIDQVQAERAAQDYLNTHGYSSYKADIVGEYPDVELVGKVKDKSTGKVSWVDHTVTYEDSRSENPKYIILVYRAYVVNVLNSNGAKVGTIYVDGADASIAYTDLPDSGDGGSDNGTSNNNTGNNSTTDQDGGNWLQDLWDALMGLFQQLWTAIFGA